MSTFMQYAMIASKEALEDAEWRPETEQQREMTVSYASSNINVDDPVQREIRAYV